MIKSKFASIIDSLFLSFIIFVILNFWLTKFLKKSILAIIISSVTSLIFLCVFLFVSVKNYNKTKITLNENKLLEKCKTALIYSGENFCDEFYKKLLSAIKISSSVYENEKIYFYIKFYSSLDSNDFITANNFFMQNKNNKKLIFLCSEKTEDFTKILKSSPIKYDIFLFEDLFLIMKKKNTYPIENNNANKKTKINGEKLKKFLTEILKNIHFKNTFLTGLSLVVLSVFVPFSLYYLTFGSILLIISFISLFMKAKPQNQVKSDSLDNYIKW